MQFWKLNLFSKSFDLCNMLISYVPTEDDHLTIEFKPIMIPSSSKHVNKKVFQITRRCTLFNKATKWYLEGS